MLKIKDLSEVVEQVKELNDLNDMYNTIHENASTKVHIIVQIHAELNAEVDVDTDQFLSVIDTMRNNVQSSLYSLGLDPYKK